MNKCDCDSTELKARMVTITDVLVTSVSGYPEHILGREDTQDINLSVHSYVLNVVNSICT